MAEIPEAYLPNELVMVLKDLAFNKELSNKSLLFLIPKTQLLARKIKGAELAEELVSELYL